MRSLGLLVALLSATATSALKIATSLQWIEHTPQPYAIKNFYKGASTATLMSGGVANLARDRSVDLAANAETQGLKQYANNRNIRLIYIICEVPYRIVADKRRGINTLSDLRGKRVGSIPGTSAGYFVSKTLASVGLGTNDYRTVSGNVCMRTPCGSNTFPQQLVNRQIDAFGVWEPAVELAAQQLGNNAILFQNYTLYREVYSLYTTTDKLADPAKRRDIIEFVRALNKTLEVFKDPEKKDPTVYQTVAQAVGMDAAVVKAVWGDHIWSGTWGPDLLPFIQEEDAWLARQDRRQAASANDLARFLDTSIINEL